MSNLAMTIYGNKIKKKALLIENAKEIQRPSGFKRNWTVWFNAKNSSEHAYPGLTFWMYGNGWRILYNSWIWYGSMKGIKLMKSCLGFTLQSVTPRETFWIIFIMWKTLICKTTWMNLPTDSIDGTLEINYYEDCQKHVYLSVG